jgi:hypothetical protein
MQTAVITFKRMFLGLQVVSEEKERNTKLIVGVPISSGKNTQCLLSLKCFLFVQESQRFIYQQLCNWPAAKFPLIPFQILNNRLYERTASVCVIKYECSLYVISASRSKELGGKKEEREDKNEN